MGLLDGRISKDGKVLEPMLSRRQVAELFGVHPTTVDNWRDLGLPCHKIGRRVLFDKADIEAFVEKAKVVTS